MPSSTTRLSIPVRPLARAAVLSAAMVAATLTTAGCGASSASTPGASRAASATNAAATGEPRFEGAPLTRTRAPGFALRDQHGKQVSLAAQRGSYVIVAFLYTHCRDVCPLIANELNAAVRQLRKTGPPAEVLAVSVDPRGDTPAAVRRFVARHHLISRFHYLTGTRRQLERVWGAYHVASYPQGSILVAHTATELLIDPQGFERVAYTSDVAAAQVVHDVHILERT
jgi:protein SCO1/2